MFLRDGYVVFGQEVNELFIVLFDHMYLHRGKLVGSGNNSMPNTDKTPQPGHNKQSQSKLTAASVDKEKDSLNNQRHGHHHKVKDIPELFHELLETHGRHDGAQLDKEGGQDHQCDDPQNRVGSVHTRVGMRITGSTEAIVHTVRAKAVVSSSRSSVCDSRQETVISSTVRRRWKFTASI